MEGKARNENYRGEKTTKEDTMYFKEREEIL